MNLKYENIGIIGAGGLGSHLVHFMYDFGYTRKQFDYLNTTITVMDNDTIEPKNLLHQNFTLDELGKSKAKVLEERYGVVGVEQLATDKDLSKFDVVFSCVDNFVFRRQLYAYGDKHPKLFWIDGRSTSSMGMIINSHISKAIRDSFITDSNESGGCLLDYEKEQNISHTLPIVVAAGMVQVFLQATRGNYITKEKVFNL